MTADLLWTTINIQDEIIFKHPANHGTSWAEKLAAPPITSTYSDLEFQQNQSLQPKHIKNETYPDH
jgi:hypothetical protein